jgi:hypothetical protein
MLIDTVFAYPLLYFMIYRLSIAANPKIFLLLFLLLLLPPAGIFALIHLGIIMGIIALAAALYFDYHMLKFLIGHLKSRIETDDTGIKCLTPMGESLEFNWKNISHAGSVAEKKTSYSLFIYSEADDRLLKIPGGYTDFDQLRAEIRDHTAFTEYELSDTETLEDRLKQIVESD